MQPAKLPDADYRAPRGAFFGSLHGTLNHLLVADRIWMRRFTGTGPYPNQLDAILYEDFDELREARTAEDARIVAYVEGLSDADIAGDVHLPHHRQPAGHHPATRAGARALLQPPDPPSRPGALPRH